MNANLARDKFLIIYYSIGGNTKQVANLIASQLSNLGQEYDLLALEKRLNPEIKIDEYKHIFIGTPTYGKGKCPEATLNMLRYLLKWNDFKLPSFSVFGTGDTQWEHFCRAVDEVEYHLSKKTRVINTLKIEQYPISKKQINDINQFVSQIIEEEFNVTTKHTFK